MSDFKPSVHTILTPEGIEFSMPLAGVVSRMLARTIDILIIGTAGAVAAFFIQILGMASVLTATSLPNRTSPVLRGKWVMEKVLSTPPKPPPPNVPDLEATREIHDELSLREALIIHRENPSCFGCHQDMDDLGFALENYDAIGRWRTTYNNSTALIDVTGSLKSGEYFDGASQLREVLISKQEQFAKGISRKMLGFALGRSIEFRDTKFVEQLAESLIENQFDPVPFIEELVLSYPFQCVQGIFQS